MSPAALHDNKSRRYFARKKTHQFKSPAYSHLDFQGKHCLSVLLSTLRSAKKNNKKKHMGLPEPCMGSTLRRFSQPFTFNNSQLFSPGRMLNNDVSAFLRLQRHSPGSTRELKKPWTATSNPDRDLCCIPHLSLPLFFSHSSTVQMVKTCIKQISPTNRLFSILPLKFFDTIQHVLPCIWGGGTTFNLCIL